MSITRHLVDIYKKYPQKNNAALITNEQPQAPQATSAVMAEHKSDAPVVNKKKPSKNTKRKLAESKIAKEKPAKKVKHSPAVSIVGNSHSMPASQDQVIAQINVAFKHEYTEQCSEYEEEHDLWKKIKEIAGHSYEKIKNIVDNLDQQYKDLEQKKAILLEKQAQEQIVSSADYLIATYLIGESAKINNQDTLRLLVDQQMPTLVNTVTSFAQKALNDTKERELQNKMSIVKAHYQQAKEIWEELNDDNADIEEMGLLLGSIQRDAVSKIIVKYAQAVDIAQTGKIEEEKQYTAEATQIVMREIRLCPAPAPANNPHSIYYHPNSRGVTTEAVVESGKLELHR